MTRTDVIDERGEALQTFLAATAEGLQSGPKDPASGNAVIKAANDGATDATLAFGMKAIRDIKVVTGGRCCRARHRHHDLRALEGLLRIHGGGRIARRSD